jgi:pimeloyl-ACP methyl ester carboxylesterase
LGPAAPLLRRSPRGDGQPVLLLPGFTAGDRSTAVLRRFLGRQGFSPHPWLQGLNLGPRDGLPEKLARRLVELYERYQRPVSLVGWSLGGVYARELAKRLPERVRQVVTLGSPFANVARASNASRLFDLLSRRAPSASRRAAAAALAEPPAVPTTSIFTKTDGVVHWSTCIETETDHTENIEVPGSHCGLGLNPLVLYAVAERLSQAEGRWQPFEYEGWRRIFYR